MLIRITCNMLTLLIPAILFAAPTGDLSQQTKPLPAVISILSASPEGLTIRCDVDEAWLGDASDADEIPSITRWIQIPGEAVPSLKRIDCNFSAATLPIFLKSAPLSQFSDPVQIGKPLTQRGVRLIPVTFNAIAMAQHGALCPLTSITVDISFPSGKNQPKRLRPALDEMWGDLIINREFPARDRGSESISGTYVYVIPDNNNVRNTINPLIQWRRQQGYNTREISCPGWADGNFVSEQLLNLDTPETPIDYILLAGDVRGNFPVPTITRGVESDYYYSFLEGEDRIPDAAVGRISYNTLSELERIVNKILNYEQRPDVQDPSWLRRGAVSAGSEQSGFSTILVSRWLRDQFLRRDWTSVDTLWYTMGGRIGDFMEREFNRGVAYVTYRGWTGLEDWSPNEAGALRNRYLPTAVLLACNSGDYAGQQTGFTESLLRAPGGAIAAIGIAGSQSRINFNNVMLASFFRGVLDGNSYRIGWALNRARIDLMATYGARENELTVDHSAWTNLMGDPATIIWRGTPRTTRITAPQQVDYGNGFFTASVVDAQTNQPIPNIRVGFVKGNEAVSADYTDEEGEAAIRFDNRRLTPGAAILTTSGDMVVPTTTQVQMTRPNQTLAFQSARIIEDNNAPRQGDGDFAAEPNEVIGLDLFLINIGAQVIDAPTTCRLETESDYCEVRVAEFRIDRPLNPNAVAQATFLVALGSDFPDRENVAFTVTARNRESVWTSEFAVSGRGPRWTITRIDMDGLPNPGEDTSFDIYLKNTGSINVGITQARLVSDDEEAEVIAGDAEYDSLSVGETGSNERAYVVAFSENTEFGSFIPFHLDLTCEGNYSASIPFTIQMAPLPADRPAGPDDYGYYALDQQDFGTNLRPNHRWEEINPRAGGPGLDTGLLDQAEDDDESVVLDLPFTFQYYGQSFDQLTVCTNGWAAFGSQPGYVDFRNMPIGTPQGPRAQLCPWWTDLYQPGVEAGVYYHYDAPRHRFIIEWYRMRQWVGPAGPGGVETFEIILHDPMWHQNTTGDGDIFFIYNEITHDARVDAHGTPYATIGLGSPDDQGGLPMGFWGRYEPGVTPPNAGVIYRFVTAPRHDYAILKGAVRVEGGDPVEGAVVRATRGGWTFTDANGLFRLGAIIANVPQRVEVSAPGYNTALSREFNIAVNDSDSVIVSLRQPQVSSDVDSFTDSLDAGDISVHHFNLQNRGNGELIVSTRPAEHAEQMIVRLHKTIAAGRDDPAEFGDRLLAVAATELTGDSRILGVAYDGDHFIASGANSDEDFNLFYRFDAIGEFVDRLDQPVHDNWGMRDLAWDGANLYGGVGEWIVKMQRQGNEVSRISSPVIPARGLAVSPDGDYWITGESQPILRLSEEGEELRSYASQLNIYGLAWHPADPDGRPLWIFSADGPTGLHVGKMDTSSGDIQSVLHLEGEQGDRPGGIELTTKWNDSVWGLAVVIQNPEGDRVEVYDVGGNLSWLAIDPADAVIQPNSAREFTVTISSEGLQGGEYIADILIEHNALEGELRIPVQIEVEPVLAGVEPEYPANFSLDGVFPNPSNGSANIRFTLPVTRQVRLHVFDSLGRMVTELVNRQMEAGYHNEIFDATLLSAGIYVVRLRSGNETFIQKFALIK